MLQEDLITAFQYLKGEGLFTRAWSDRTRDNGLKLEEGRFFTMRVMRHWNSLLREVVDGSSLEVFKARLDEAFSKMA